MVQIVGRFVDLQWHATHAGFETGRDQVTAHWLVWLGTLLIIAAAVWALRSTPPDDERRGYLVLLWSNLIYVVVAVVHFIQHLDHQEVNWAHVSLGVLNTGSVVGVLMVAWVRLRRARTEQSRNP